MAVAEFSQLDSLHSLNQPIGTGLSVHELAHELASVQQVVWLDQMLHPEVPCYNIGGVLQIDGDLDVALLVRAVNEVANANDALRLVLHQEAGLPFQRVQPWVDVDTPLIDVSGEVDAPARASAHLQAAFNKPFDLYGGLLWRSQLVRVSPSRHYWLLGGHHLIGDGAGMFLVARSVLDVYAQRRRGEASSLPAAPSYLEFVADDRAYLASPRYQRDAQFWQERFAQVSAPLFTVSDMQASSQALPSAQVSLSIARSRFDRLADFATANGCTVPHLMLALLAAYFARTRSVEEVVIGVPVHNRTTARDKRTVGMFASVIPLRIPVDPQQPFAALMQTVAAQLRQCYRHQRFPIADLNRLLKVAGFGRKQLYDLSLVMDVYPADFVLEGGAFKASQIKMNNGHEQTPLTVRVCEYNAGEDVVLDFVYNTAFLAGASVGDIRRRVECLMQAVLDDDGHQPVAALSLIDEAERTQVLVGWNDTARLYPQALCVHALFEAQARRRPEAVALVHGGESLSYGELNARANRLARYLRAQGVVPDSRVAVCVERSVELVVGILAVLKAGGCYVPLDPAHASERLHDMLADCAPVAALTHASAGAAMQAQLHTAVARHRADAPVLDLVSDAERWAREDASDLPLAGLEPQHLAYIMYTSGSTGVPKGVMVPHRAVVKLVVNNGYADIETNDRVAFAANPAFDATTFELWAPLLNGGACVVIDQDTLLHPARFADALAQQHVTVMWLTAGLFNQYVDALAGVLPGLRYLIVGGEALDPKIIAKVLSDSAPGRLLNGYGPTETTTFAITHEVRQVAADAHGIPLGRPIGNTRIYILDARMQPVPVGVAGELYIGGDGVARGYLNQPELTAERFIDDPFAAGGRMYKSGDLGQWLNDGTIEYLGRNDQQVKIRGFRIEPGEIEAKLAQLEGVREVVVLAREDQAGDKRLVAYYTGDSAKAEQLREHAAQALPAYMVPAAYVRLEAWPLTPNGKLDRKALPAPEGDAFASRSYEAPQGEVEQALADLWAEALKLDRVGRHDNFFELGGHSLLAIGLIERMRKQQLNTDVRTLFSAATLAELAARVSNGAANDEVVVPPNLIPVDATHITPQMLSLVTLSQEAIDAITLQVPGGAANVQDIYPLAPLQEGILFHHMMQPEADPYLLNGLLAFTSRERLDRFLAALQHVIDRHDILRTGFAWEGLEQPMQVVRRQAQLMVTQVELDPALDAVQQMQERHGPRNHRMDVRQAPLLRCHIAQADAGGRWLLSLLVHHLVSDRTTVARLLEEVRMIEQGLLLELPTAVPFRNFVAQARLGVSVQEHEAFFTQMLGDIEEPTAPFGLLDVQDDGQGSAEVRQELDLELAQTIRQQARRLGVSAASLMHLAWALVVARTSARQDGMQDVVFGTVLFGRMQGGAQADRALGLFINTLPLRVSVGEQSVEESVRRTHELLAQLMRHEHAPLALAQRCSALEAQTPLFTSLLNYRHGPSEQGGSAAGDGVEVLHGEGRTNYPLTMSVDDLGQGLGFSLTAQASAPIDPQRVCEFMETALRQLMQALQESPRGELRRIDVLPARELAQVLVDWNDTAQAYPQALCVHELFEAQARRAPDAAALVHGEESLSYGELNARANRLARHLRDLGVVPDSRVAVCVERSTELVVALLAILKAGGAYVPLDPAYASERLAATLADSRPVVVLLDATGRHALGAVDAVVVDLHADVSSWAHALPDNLDVHQVSVSPRHLAYVIYTSGSTGVPKGVMVEHRSLNNLVHWHIRAFGLEPGSRGSATAGLGFDASAWEIWPVLCSGGALLLPTAQIAGDAQQLLQWWQSQSLDVSFLVTPLAELAYATGRVNAGVRSVLIGGDRLRRWPDALPAGQELINNYGPTETTVVATSGRLSADDDVLHIGRPIGNTRVYILDARMQLVPVGVAGELYIGGDGVARGYLNQPELTAERFIDDPFVDGARMYKSGDLCRWLNDGTIEYLGRNDQQVKVRGFRIEPGEIEVKLAQLEGVREVVVLAREDQAGEKRLVAYYTSDSAKPEQLREHAVQALPAYMVPAAYVHLETLPLTPNGKLDRKSLPAPEGDAYVSQHYEAPQGETETVLASLWAELLKLDRVGRHDNFFELGGHSLLAISLIERMRKQQLHTDVRTLFSATTLAELAARVSHGAAHDEVVVPPNLIPADASHITPQMLNLVTLSQEAIDAIVRHVPDGAANVQDIYPLAPLQEGILFHHLMQPDADPYLLHGMLGFASRGRLDRFLAALQQVIDRHDILRTGFAWEGLEHPVQVVRRQAQLVVEQVEIDPTQEQDAVQQLQECHGPRNHRLDVRHAPLLHGRFAHDTEGGRWLLSLLAHHLVADHTALERLFEEAQAIEQGRLHELPPAAPFRNFVAQARLGVSAQEHESFFRQMLGDIEEPTAPFGLLDVQGDGSGVVEARQALAPELAQAIRQQARRLGVSAASLMHLAWALVVARTSARQDVVFGTVLFGRMQGGDQADRALGLFINTLPLRVSVGGQGVEESVKHTHALLAQLMRHEHAPLALAQRCSAVAAQTPLFTSLLNYRHGQEIAGQKSQTAGDGIEVLHGEERTNYPLMMSVDDLGQGFELNAQSTAAIDPQRVCEFMEAALHQLMRALKEAPHSALQHIDVLPTRERAQVLVGWNDTAQAYRTDQCIHDLFEAQVQRTPEATALVHDNESLSYAQLNARANQLAHQLIAQGVQPDSRVAVCVDRSLEMVIGLLAILKAGGAYVPLDPGYPAARLAHLLSNADAALLLVDHAGRLALGDMLPPASGVLDLDAAQPAWHDQPDTDPRVSGLTPRNLAYVIYTSGSTGLPKGVMNEHAGVVNRLLWMQEAYGLDGHDVVLQKTPFSFDVSVWEFFWPLMTGARLVMARPEGHKDPGYLSTLIRDAGVTTLHFVPSMLQVFLEHEGGSHRSGLVRVMCSGEALPATLVRGFHAQFPGVELHNLYGPTEAAVDVTAWACEPGDARGAVPIGRPIANTHIYILDERMQPAPIGVAGELYIGGVQVARGYLGQPQLTAERFIDDPFAAGGRMYKSGDLARWLDDGAIEYLGRNDHQVKIRGFRIELGEVEAKLAQLEGVREAVVLAREDQAGNKRLVAYYTSDSANAEQLREHAAQALPAYMVPAAYVRLETWPLTPNGKLDRKALPAPEGEAYVSRNYEAPQGEVEGILASLWQEQLGLDRVGRHDNFFELGGHSLMAISLIERMRRQQLHTDVRTLFGAATLAELAARVSAQGAVTDEVVVPPNRIPVDAQHITPQMLSLVTLSQEAIDAIALQVPGGAANVQDIYPLAPLQEGILFHHLMQTDADPYLLHGVLGFASRERLDRFLEALQLVIDRHDILRTSFAWEGLEHPVQVVWRKVQLVVEQVELDPTQDAARQMQERHGPRHHRLDARQAPLLRLHMAADGASGRWVLNLLVHHLVTDHTTLERLLEEVQMIERGRLHELPPAAPFRNFVAQARLGVSAQAHEVFFKQMLEDIEETTAPFGLLDVQGDGQGTSEVRQELEPELAKTIRQQARRLGVSAASLMHLAWALVVARTSARQDVVFGTVLFGRMQGGAEADRALGLFINTLPLRVSVGGQDSVEAAVRRTHDLLARLLRHEHAPLALAQRCSAVEAQTPLFTSLLNYRHGQEAAPQSQAGGDEFEVLHGEERTNYPLTMSVDDLGQSFALTAEAIAPIDPQRVCEFMQTALRQLMQALQEAPHSALRQIDVLPAPERQQVLVDWNDTARAYRKDQCVHQLFEAQARRTPEATAVVHGEQQWSYAQLDARANQLARHLRDLGVVPDSRVAVCLERSVDLVVAILAILKAGGAYVPLDPAYAGERLAAIVEDSRPVAVLHDATGRKALGSIDTKRAPVIDLRLDAASWAQMPGDDLDAGHVAVTPRHMAYVIYTSGSTGVPKGVMVEHRNVVNQITAFAERIGLQAQDRILQFASLAFDASVEEIFASWARGATLVLRSDEWLAGARDFWALCEKNEISVIGLPTLFWGQLALAQERIPSCVRQIVIGGEAVSEQALQAWFKGSEHRPRLLNTYGPTETTVDVTAHEAIGDGHDWRTIGRPIANTRIYILDARMQPVPVGVAGELYIAGAQVARGYLNQPELTAERFLDDPFVAGERMYRSGDLGRWLDDGTIEYLGRNDQQVKIRGFRIEPGEIEAKLAQFEGVREVVVLVREDQAGDKRLVAYYTGDSANAEQLREHAAQALPAYMVPAAYVRLDALPATPNGKLDRKALPAPEGDAYVSQHYEAPQGEIETVLASLWQELLGVERVGRHDNFFELGGHSLLAISLIERMRRQQLHADVRTLFGAATLAELATRVNAQDAADDAVAVPANLIPADATHITPPMLSLVTLSQASIDAVVAQVPGGAANVQDIYPLAPLQEGILFHHRMQPEADPYLVHGVLGFRSRERLDRFLAALQHVIDRHDILRTGFAWEGLEQPVQVVRRQVQLVVEQLELDPAQDAVQQLQALCDPRSQRLDLRQAPVLRSHIAQDEANGRWLLSLLMHHLVSDRTTVERLLEEVQMIDQGRLHELPPAAAFRNFVAQARLGVSVQEHEAFFAQMLGDIEEPTAPFGLSDVQGDGRGLAEARQALAPELAQAVRQQARRLGVSAASLMHLAWALVVARTSARQDVVFGTVLFGRMQGGAQADRALGLFINTLPLRVSVGEQGVEESVKHTHALLARLMRHEHAPLALAQRCSAVEAQTPLFTSLLNYRHGGGAQESEAMAGEIEVLHGEERTNYPLTMSVDDLGEGFELNAQVSASVDPHRVCEFMQTALRQLMQALQQAPRSALRNVDVLPASERQQVLIDWNDTTRPYPQDQCVHALFEAQVRRTPEATALVHGDESLSYAELNARANRLARHLRAQGVVPDSRVAVCVERSVALVVGILAILKAGGAYVPMDPAHASERLQNMLQDSAPVAALTNAGAGAAVLAQLRTAVARHRADAPVLDIERDASQWADEDASDLPPAGLAPQHLAYIMYTSGSTGAPKGVMVPHQAVVKLIVNNGYADIGAHDRVAFAANPAFDAITFEMWAPLLEGGTCVVIDHDTLLNPARFADALRQHRVTALFLTTALFNQYADTLGDVLSGLRYLMVGGEAPDPRVFAKVLNDSPPAHLLHVYGPTETTTFALMHEVRHVAADARGIPLGRPIANTRLYILDDRMRPVPVGVAGELYIGGDGVARGYLNQPERTAERFIDDPFVGGGRMYRSGDLGRWLDDGTIDFLGRNDQQVKIRGFRIEPGEIEAKLAQLNGVREVVVLAREDQTGSKRLVAYYTAQEQLQTEQLREHAAQALPAYMVPAAYVRLDALPLTPNGKLDRKALPAPEGDAFASRSYEAPQGEVELALAELWAEALKLDRVGRHDNFFELGGHSLLAIGLIERMRRQQLNTDVRTLFSAATLAELAAQVSAQGAAHDEVAVPPNLIPVDASHITPQMLSLVTLSQEAIDAIVDRVPGGAANVQDIYPLAPLQEGILFHHMMQPDSDPYLLHGLLAFKSRERLDRFLGALQHVIDRHDILRTGFVWEGLEQPVQVVLRQAQLVVAKIELDPTKDAVQQLQERHGPQHQRLDVRQAPLLRCHVAPDAIGGRWLLSLLVHHLVSDRTTVERLLEEVHLIEQGQLHELPPAAPFRNFVAQARLGVSVQEHEAFFQQMLGDIEEPTAPFGLLDVQDDGLDSAEVRQEIDLELAQAVRQQARRLGVSAASLMHLAWALVVARTSARQDVVFGTVLFGRMQGGAQADRALGLFINTLPLRVSVGEQGVEESVKHTHALLARLMRHEHAPLALAQRCSAVEAQTPLFTSLLNYRHGLEAQEAQLTGDEIEVLQGDGRSNYPLTMSVDDLGQGFALTAQACAPIDPQRVCEFMEAALRQLMRALRETPHTALRHIDVLPVRERAQVLVNWNDTAQAYPQALCVHELFEAQARRTPEATALVHGDGSLSYAQLNAWANQLAHRLVGQGVVPDSRVAVCVERSAELVVALLAILKAGGAYVPLDPAYASERLTATLADSQPVVVLLDATGRQALGSIDTAVIDLHADAASWAYAPQDDLDVRLTGTSPRHLAYVIYTSGSTGVPKGVMVEHRSLNNLVHWHVRAFGLEPGSRGSATAGLGFDASAWEIWPVLCSGGALLLPTADVAGDAQQLLQWWQSQSLDVSFLVTPLAELAYATGRVNAGVRSVLIGGDRLRRWPDALPAGQQLINNYGPTETTVVATSGRLSQDDAVLHIGKPIGNTRVYILDAQMQPVPVGVAGELYIGGDGVARGYLNQPELTAERFIDDPFVDGARMYKSGDLCRWLNDGTIEYLGRNDQQVKIRGFRIEPGEIEVKLAQLQGVREVVVLAREDQAGEKRLVAYYTSDSAKPEQLREHAAQALPAYMVPAAYVHLETLPLTPNGKLDRKALPAPEGDAFASRSYEAPQGEVERALADLWAEALKLDRVGRHDNFFELGGHSLLAISLIERMRKQQLHTDVRTLFSAATLAELAARVSEGAAHGEVVVPSNLIPADATHITPQMLSLVTLSQEAIDSIVDRVPGGAANVQDIYPLAPLQEGILFHHMMQPDSDPYLLHGLLAFKSCERLDRFLSALQQVIDRHDILRTGFAWEGLEHPVQVVRRQAQMAVAQVELDPTQDAVQQLQGRQRLDVRQAPLLHGQLAHDAAGGRWLLSLVAHHLVVDHTALERLFEEAQAIEQGRLHELPPAAPFRNFVAQARLGVSAQEHETFFQQMLGDIEEPTAPFGLLDVQGDGHGLVEARQELAPELAQAVRQQARRLGVSAASLMHLAWALVVARTSARQDVVFGTVLFGRMQGGDQADRALGLFINTLPLRVSVGGQDSVEEGVRKTHDLLARLLRHEHAPLALAQRCSAVAAQTPLFTSLLNYRHSPGEQEAHAAASDDGIEVLHGEERTNYPLTMSVDDLGQGFALSAQVIAPIDPQRVCEFMQTALRQLMQALQEAPRSELRRIDVLPASERQQVLVNWNDTAQAYPQALCVHELFEAQARRTPDATALVHGDGSLSYAQLNARANQLAHRLVGQGVVPDSRVAVCVERSAELVVALLAILKAGGAYVPLDPAYASERLTATLADSQPVVVLLDAIGRQALGPIDKAVIDLHADAASWAYAPQDDLDVRLTGTSPRHLAYVIYTSGSTGVPKGVMVEHRSLNNLVHWHIRAFGLEPGSRGSATAGLGFDASAWEIWPVLCSGGALLLPTAEIAGDAQQLLQWWQSQSLDVSFLVTPLAELAYATGRVNAGVRAVLIGGDRLRRWPDALPAGQQLINNYGPTETTVVATSGRLSQDDAVLHIGKPIGNTRVYILDAQMQPVPVGVAGELYIGGDGVARGYLNQPELTAERFIDDPFVDGARMYKSGDLCRWLNDGTIEYLGRNDQQVKIRGFRIEPGEIEVKLAQLQGVREVVVLAREDQAGEKRLVAYYTAEAQLQAEQLREHAVQAMPAYMVPAAYVHLETLPLTPNGKLDRKALPAPEGDAYVSQHYEAPQGETETVLASLWAELLKLDRVGRHDNFFELGGHSLLAISLQGRVRAALGREIALGTLFEAPSIAELAARLNPQATPSEPSSVRKALLPLRTQGRHPPLFCIHPGGGFGWSFTGLLRHLPDRPVYALQARRLSEPHRHFGSIEAIAADYLAQIRSVQPIGPYHLLGWSQGGHIAHAIATQLQAQGERVGQLVMLDSYPIAPQTVLPRAPDNQQMMEGLLQFLLPDAPQAHGAPALSFDAIRRRLGDAGHPLFDMDDAVFEAIFDEFRSAPALIAQYRPRVFQGNVLFFRAALAEPGHTAPPTPDVWQSSVSGRIVAHDVACLHEAMMHPEPLTRMGPILAAALAAMPSPPGTDGIRLAQQSPDAIRIRDQPAPIAVRRTPGLDEAMIARQRGFDQGGIDQ